MKKNIIQAWKGKACRTPPATAILKTLVWDVARLKHCTVCFHNCS